MNNELLPCPFCGGKVRPAVERPMGHGDMESRIVCHCGLKYTSNAPCEALERCWNRRHKPASAQVAVILPKRIAADELNEIAQGWNCCLDAVERLNP